MPRRVQCSLSFEERQLLNSCHFTGRGLASSGGSVFTWQPHLAPWTEIPSALGAQRVELELELESVRLHSFLLLETLLPPRNTGVFKLVVSLLVFYKLEAQNASCPHEHKQCWGYLGCVYLFPTHKVCLAWQPAGPDNNNALLRRANS